MGTGMDDGLASIQHYVHLRPCLGAPTLEVPINMKEFNSAKLSSTRWR